MSELLSCKSQVLYRFDIMESLHIQLLSDSRSPKNDENGCSGMNMDVIWKILTGAVYCATMLCSSLWTHSVSMCQGSSNKIF